MAVTIRKELIVASLNKIVTLTDFKIYNGITERYEFQKRTILNDDSLTKVERTEAIKSLTVYYDYQKILYNEGTKRFCEKCQKYCFATLYCENCVRTYLKNNFSRWTSGNNYIDELIQKCQMESLRPDQIEWIPYNNLQDIKYMTKGGCSEIYSADWIDGRYIEWNSKKQQLERSGTHEVILKRLKNVNNANKSWVEKAKSHLTISNKYSGIVRSYGLTQDPSNGDYMLVMYLMGTDLRKYLQHHQCTWKEKVNVAYDIIEALYRIHLNSAIHQDLHSGNILYSQDKNFWCISDLGFCGPADKPLKSIYGNLSYIAPEILVGKEYTFASDIYSFGILMWEISLGQIPFDDHEHNYDLAMKIVNGMRPKIMSGIPPEYEKLMKQCWNADPLKRPDTVTLLDKIKKMRRDSYNDNNANEFNTLEYNNSSQIFQTNLSSSSLSTSKLYQFENLPEPRNATEEQQEAFHSTPVDNIKEFDNNPILHLKNQDDLESKSIINKINDEPNNQNDGKNFCLLEQDNLGISEGEDEIQNHPNFHLEQEDNLEIPEGYNTNFHLEQQDILEIPKDENETYDNPNFHSEQEDNLGISEGENNPNFHSEQEDNLGILEGNNEIYNNPNFHSEQKNNLEIPEVIENLTKSTIIEEKQDNLATPKVIDNFNELNNKSENIMKSVIIKEIDKSNNQFEKVEYNEKNKLNLENQDCYLFKDGIKRKTGNLKKRFSITKYIKKLPKWIRKGR